MNPRVLTGPTMDGDELNGQAIQTEPSGGGSTENSFFPESTTPSSTPDGSASQGTQQGQQTQQRQAPAPTDPNLGAGGNRAQAQPGQQQAQAQPFDFRRAISKFGVALPEDTDPEAFLGLLVQEATRARQADHNANLTRQFGPQNPAQQQGQAAPQRSPEESRWERPQYDKRYFDAGLIAYDEKMGLVVGKPGVSQDVIDQANRYVRWSQDKTENEEEYLGYMIQKNLQPILESKFKQFMEVNQVNSVSDRIVQNNESWLYAKDDRGQFQVGRDNRRVLSPSGQAYFQCLNTIETEYGITDPAKQDKLARTMMMAAARQQAAAQQNTANPVQTRQAMAAPNRNGVGTQSLSQRMDNAGNSEQGYNKSKPLHQSIVEELEREGISRNGNSIPFNPYNANDN
jgi:hypothetical protein